MNSRALSLVALAPGLALAILAASGATFRSASTACAADWPQLQRDAERTGRTSDAVAWPYRIRWIWLGPGQTLRNQESEPGWPDDLTCRDGYDLPLPATVPYTLSEQAQPVISGGRVFIGDQEGTVYGLNAADGATLWSQPNPGGTWNAAAVAGNSVCFVSLQGFVSAFDAATGALRWRFDTGRSITGSPLLHGGVLYTGNHAGRVFALDPSTGALRWSTRLGGSIQGTLAGSGSLVYALAENMILYALRTSDGSIAAQRQLRGQSGRMLWPVVQENRVYVRTVMIPIIGSEFLLDDLHAASTDFEDEQNRILQWYEGNGPYQYASPDWRDLFVLDTASLNELHVVATGPTEGCGKPAEPPCVDNQGRVLLWWNTRYPTLTNNWAFGTNYSVDISAVDPVTGRRVRIDNGQLASTRQDVDNLYGLSVGGDILFLRQGWYGTMAIRLTDSAGRFVSAYDNGWVGYDVFYDGTAWDGTSDYPSTAHDFIEGRCPVSISDGRLFLGEHFGVVALETAD